MQNCKVKTKPLYIKISTLAWTERYIGFICRFIATFNHCLGFRVSQKNSVRVFSLPQAELCRGVRHALSTSGCLLTFNPGWVVNVSTSCIWKSLCFFLSYVYTTSGWRKSLVTISVFFSAFVTKSVTEMVGTVFFKEFVAITSSSLVGFFYLSFFFQIFHHI